MRRFLSGLCVIASLCLAVIAPASAERFDQYFLSDQRLSEIEAVGIAPSSDAWVLFEAFAQRFSIATAHAQGDPRDIRRMTETGRGDRNALAFLLLNLFRWNGIDAELALLSTKAGTRPDDAIEDVLVYVSALDQYFDPALPPNRQPKSADRIWLDGRNRMHVSAALRHLGRAIGRCQDLCVSVSHANRLPGAKRVKTGTMSGGAMPGAVRVKTEAVSAPATRTP